MTLSAKRSSQVTSKAWLHGEGTELPVKMEYDTSLAQQAYDLAYVNCIYRSMSEADLYYVQRQMGPVALELRTCS